MIVKHKIKRCRKYLAAGITWVMVMLASASAYRQLRPTEKSFVDGFVAFVEREAERKGERISNFLYREIDTETVANSRGLLEKPMVRAAISERINEIAQATELTVGRIVKELSSIAFSNHLDYAQVGEDGYPTWDFTKCTPEQMAAVKSFELDETDRRRRLKVVTHDKLAALTLLARYTGMLENDNPHWRADTARPVNAALPANIDEQGAADAYSRMING